MNHRPLPLYDIHPTSSKLIRQGHPWVTMDEFSEKFHPKERFIVATDRNRPFALLIHDPTHKNVRARVWATRGNFPRLIKSFRNDLAIRIRQAVKKRKELNLLEKRNHFYLIFGEADGLPGILVHYLNGDLLIQFYMDFWKQYQENAIQNIIKSANEVLKTDINFENLWIQYRSDDKTLAKCSDMNVSYRRLEIEEYGVKYKAVLGKYYDHGIYTDMAAIRYSLKADLENSKSLLNLYSYTGAFSLFGMKCGIEDVVSVDLSEKYIDWLEDNFTINKDLTPEHHTSMVTSTKDALIELIEDERTFDFIISDPPSSSSDGVKRTNALTDYGEVLPMMDKVCSDTGKILVFLNTHSVAFKKFEDKIQRTINNKKLNLKVEKRLYMNEDCPTFRGFPEGSYLKGIILKRGPVVKVELTEEEKIEQQERLSKKAKKRVNKPRKPRAMESNEVQGNVGGNIAPPIHANGNMIVEKKSSRDTGNMRVHNSVNDNGNGNGNTIRKKHVHKKKTNKRRPPSKKHQVKKD